MKRMLLLSIAVAISVVLHAQLLSWTPPFPKEDDPSQTLVITVDAAKGNQGLLNYSPTTDVYVHLGVITNLSTGPTNWKYVKFNQNFNQPNAQLQATYAGNNKWQFTITGSLKTYFGVPANETILKIAILFRNGLGTKKQATTDNTNSDMYIPIYGSALAVRIDQPASQPKYIPVPEPQSWTAGSPFSITANANKPSAMKLYHNGTVIASGTNVQTLSGNSTVAAVGNQQIVAEANDGTTTKYDTLNIFVSPTSSPVAALPAGVKDGINYEQGDTSVILVLRAPAKNKATVIGDFTNWIQSTNYLMNKTPDGKFFWLRIHPLTAGTEYGYQYIVDDTIKIADPYTEKVLDPSNDQSIPASTYPNLKPYPAGQTGMVSVLQTAAPAYNWTVNSFSRPDKRNLVIYELLIRDFVMAHDWKTITDSLNYLKKLGINAIEVMPFNEFEGNLSWGYNPDFYFAPDKYYGTKNSLKTFIDSCHKKGIAVIMDIVLNHTYGPSPLKLLYYNSSTGQPASNNPWYNVAAPHAFGFGDDFNHESADTKYFFNRVVQHWISEYKIDGYRFDFSKGLTQKPSSNDATFSAYDATRIAIIKGYYDAIKAVDANAYLILEHFCDNTEEKELSDNGMMLWANVWTQYQEASMGYIGNSNLDWGTYVARGWTNPHLVTFMESHDEERVTFKNEKYGNAAGSYNIKDTATALKRMELNAAFLFTIPGPKMIWQFGELGYDYSRCYLSTNGEGGDCDKKLDAKPIRWDYLTDNRRKAVYSTYSSLINLRFHPSYRNAFTSGTIDRSLSGNTKWIKVSSGDTSHLLVVGNFDVTAQTATVTFQTAGTWYDYLNNTTFTSTGSAQSISLQPGEFHVYLNKNVNNLSTTPVVNVPWDGSDLQAKVYPNPAQSNFTVEVSLPQRSDVHIDLYSTLGQHISTLHNGQLLKGTHQLSMDRKGISTGVYYLRIATNSTTKTIQVTFQ
jgi:glycosidase